MAVSLTKLAQIRRAARTFVSNEEQRDEDGQEDTIFSEEDLDYEERIGEAVFNLAMKLNLQEETVDRYFQKYLEQEL